MKTFLNIRGTNGSGKSTLAKRFMGDFDADTGLNKYRAKNGSQKIVTGVYNPETLTMLVGPYYEHGGGFDRLPSFAVQQDAVRHALAMDDVEVVVGEGILASTTIGSWKTFAEELKAAGHRTVWAYIAHPLERCYRQLDARREAHGKRKKPYKAEDVAAKHRKIMNDYEKVKDADWVDAVMLTPDREWEELCQLLGR